MALQLPARRTFASRDDFGVAVTAACDELRRLYENADLLREAPDWASERNSRVFHAALPDELARQERGISAMLASIVNQMIERGKSIVRLARVEREGKIIVFIEAE